jgi:hypothetical protein
MMRRGCDPESLRRTTNALGTSHLAGATALVTGGGSGLGRVVARALATAGAAVGVIARSPGELDETVTSRIFRWPTLSAYAVSKSALVKFTENLASEVRLGGVSVFSFHRASCPSASGRRRWRGGSARLPGGGGGRLGAASARPGPVGRPGPGGGAHSGPGRGPGRRLSGFHLSLDDDIDVLLERLDDVLRQDLHMLRLRRHLSDCGESSVL